MAKAGAPLRRCVGCGEMKEKTTLFRIAKSKEGEIRWDASQKTGGRGAYLCQSEVCVRSAQKRRGLERALRCGVPGEIYLELLQEMERGADE